MESICQVCRKPFEIAHKTRKFNFCSPYCRSKHWKKSNPERNRNHQNKWKSKTRIKPDYRLKYNISREILRRLKGERKSNKAIGLLGCSIPELRSHLESLFKPGMTWANHGVKGWHIDHKRPIASFDLSKPEEQAKCFHFSNLQPLWWRENCVVKRGKWDGKHALTL